MKQKNYITTAPNFFKLAGELQKKFFPNVKYYRDDHNCAEVHYAIELFNNGCLGYDMFIERLTKACMSSKKRIHSIVSKYISDFGDFNFSI